MVFMRLHLVYLFSRERERERDRDMDKWHILYEVNVVSEV